MFWLLNNMRDNLFYIKSSKSIEIQKEKEIILEIDLRTKYSHVGIMKNENIIIFTDEFSDDRRIPSVVCFIDDRWIIGVEIWWQNILNHHYMKVKD